MRWTSQEDAMLADLASAGMASAAVAEQLGRTTFAVQHRACHLRRAGTAIIWRGERQPQPQAVIERIRELAAPDELSAGQIAAALGLTRNAVIGLCRRRGIKLRAPRQRAIRLAQWSPRRKPTLARAVVPVIIVDLDDYRPPLPACEAVADATPSESVAFADLRAGQCRWIDGQPDGLETRYCGVRTVPGKSWCAKHYHQCFDVPRTIAAMKRAKRAGARP